LRFRGMSGNPGRGKNGYSMQKKYAIGIDIGGTNMRVGLVSEGGEVVRKIKEPTSDGLLDATFKALDSLFSKEIAGIGIGIAGLIDREKGRVLSSPNLRIAEGIDLVDEIGKRYGVPVVIENDANAAALGEMWAGAGRDFSDFVLFTLGTGIGGGLICGRRLLNVSAEIGHMSISTDGEKCHCGNYGCLESYASARYILSKAIAVLETGRESLLSGYCNGNIYKLTTEDIFRAALDGDMLARELLKNAGRYLGIGIANMVNIMSPEAVILAGGLIGAWDIYVNEAVKEASRRAMKELYERVKVIPALLKDNAGIIGSAGLVFQENKGI
jgi:glucokinase